MESDSHQYVVTCAVSFEFKSGDKILSLCSTFIFVSAEQSIKCSLCDDMGPGSILARKDFLHGSGHKSWQLFYFVDICEWITNVYVSCEMSAGIVSTHAVNTLSFRLYMSHFSHQTGIVEKQNSCHDFCPNLYILKSAFNFHRACTLPGFINFNLQSGKTYTWIGSTWDSKINNLYIL